MKSSRNQNAIMLRSGKLQLLVQHHIIIKTMNQLHKKDKSQESCYKVAKP